MKISTKQLEKVIKEVVSEEYLTEASMTRQHFQLIADVLKNNHADSSLIAAFADALHRTNPRFNRDAFVAASQLIPG